MEGITILVVDDEFRMRKLVKDFLIKEKCNVLEAEDGEDALNIFEREKEILRPLSSFFIISKWKGYDI